MNGFLFGSLAALALAACQPPADASSPSLPPSVATIRVVQPPAASALASAPATAAPASSFAEPTEEPEATPEPAPGSPEGIARTLLKEGGITYSASKKAFLFTISWNEEGNGAGRRVEILGEDGKRESVEICWPAECEEKADELPEKFGPAIAARVRDGGYIFVKPARWPSVKTEMEVLELGAKLRFKKDHIEIVGAKRATALAKLKFSAPHKPEPDYVVVAPDKSLFAVGYSFDPGSKYGEGFNLYTEVHVYRAP
jgi:hypothetical protein